MDQQVFMDGGSLEEISAQSMAFSGLQLLLFLLLVLHM